MIDPAVIGSDISRLVQSSPNGQILGSALAVLVKRVHPDFRPDSFGCTNLRDFIRRYAKDIFESARRGSDVTYSTVVIPSLSPDATRWQEFRAISSAPTSPRKLIISTPVWKTFVSPNAFYRIFANRDSGEFRILRRNEEIPPDPWVQVQPCSATTHLQIAREFLENLSDETAKIELAKILALDSWWNHFFVAARQFNVESLWSSFRRRRLHMEFEQRLKSLGVPLPTATPRVSIPIAVPIPIPIPIPIPSPLPCESAQPPEARDSVAQSEDEGAQLRRIASAVLGRLPISDLRQVWLPLGYVLDEIGKK